MKKIDINELEKQIESFSIKAIVVNMKMMAKNTTKL